MLCSAGGGEIFSLFFAVTCKIILASQSSSQEGEHAVAKFPETSVSLILRLAEHDDVQAWQDFVEIYAPAIRAMAVNKGLQAADAEDVAQDTLYAVARAIQRFEPDGERAKFRTWLGRIARNLMADFCAGRAKRSVTQAISDSWLEDVVAQSEPAIDDAFENEYRRSIFRLAANRVRQRVASVTWEAFVATAIAGEPAAEAAARLELSVGSLYVARCRVLKLLRCEVELLESEFSGCDQSSWEASS